LRRSDGIDPDLLTASRTVTSAPATPP